MNKNDKFDEKRRQALKFALIGAAGLFAGGTLNASAAGRQPEYADTWAGKDRVQKLNTTQPEYPDTWTGKDRVRKLDTTQPEYPDTWTGKDRVR